MRGFVKHANLIPFHLTPMRLAFNPPFSCLSHHVASKARLRCLNCAQASGAPLDLDAVYNNCLEQLLRTTA